MSNRIKYWIANALRRDQRSSRNGRPCRARLGMEHLEDRLAPAVFNVNSLADVLNPGPGVVTLRSAINAANFTPGGNTINLTVPGTYRITLLSQSPSATNPSNDFDIVPWGGNLTIANTSGSFVAVDGGFNSRVFDINPDNFNVPFTVTFQGFVIQHGSASPSDGVAGSGGGIRSIGPASVVLDNMILTDNFATADGGGISMENLSNTPWTLTIKNKSFISNNFAGDAGGGVETDGQGQVFINGLSQITNNTCVNQGAGIWLDAIGPVSANLTLDSAIVANNVAFNGPTGGIGNAGNGSVSLNFCTVAMNYSGTTGGGFGDENMLGNLKVNSCLFTNNFAGTNGGAIQAGGDGTTTTISNSDITTNVAQGNQSEGTLGGGGIFFTGGTATVINTRISNNVAPNGGGIEDAATVLALTQDTLDNNHAVGTNGGDPAVAGPGGKGGGIDAPSGIVSVSVNNCLFLNNTAVNGINGDGGAIDQGTGLLTVTNSQFTGNVASHVGGGMFFNGTQLVISNTTLNQDQAVNGGGAILFAGSGTFASGSGSTLVNDTLFANSTLLDGGGLGLAPSLSGASGDVLILNDTINGNTAGRSGGGIANGSAGVIRIQNTLVSGNTAPTSPDLFTPVPLTDGGGNLLGTHSIPGLTSSTDKFGPPNLFPLNGTVNTGPTAGSTFIQQIVQTEFPMPNSLAIGNGVSTGAPATDAGGFPRPALFVTNVSIGAVEPPFIGQPSVTFVLGPDHQVYGRQLDAGGNPTGGYFLTAPGQFSAIAVARLEGTGFEVFGISLSDHQVYAETFDAAGNQNGFFLVQPGAVQAITVGNDASGLPLLFAVGLNNQVSVAQFDNAGNPMGSYSPIAGGAVRSITLGADASHNPELFAIGTDSQVYYAKFDAAGNPLTGLVLAHSGQVTQISVGADAAGDPELFAIMLSDSQVYSLKFDATGNPLSGYTLVGAGAVKQIAVGAYGNGSPELFAIMLSDSQV